MKLTILKIKEPVYFGELEKIILPTINGEIEILPNHTPIMTSLVKGVIKYWENDEEKQLEIEKGFVEVNKGEVLVLL